MEAPEDKVLVDSDPQKTTSKPFSPLFRQCLAALGPVAAITSSGMTSGFSAVLLPQLTAANSTMPITVEEASWIGWASSYKSCVAMAEIDEGTLELLEHLPCPPDALVAPQLLPSLRASIAVLSMALGCVLAGVLMDPLGRRLAHLLVCVPFVLSWVALSLAPNVATLYAGRFFTGLCVGFIGPLSPVYMAEIAEPQYRGFLLSTVTLAVALGILLAHILGTYLRWQLVAATAAILPFICYITLYAVPESPVWLIAKGQMKEARDSFHWFRGYGPEADAELLAMLEKHKLRSSEKTVKVNWWLEIRSAAFIKPFIVMCIFFLLQQYSGVNAVAFYTISIIQGMGSDIDEYKAMLLIDSIRLLVSVAACVMVRYFGRRSLAVSSSLGTATSLIGLGLLLKFLQPVPPWLPPLFLTLYICFVSVGLVPLPWMMVGEVFPATTRGVGSGASSAFCFLMFFAVVKTGLSLFTTLGPHGAFFLYGSVSLLGTIFLQIFLPETQNRTLQDIEQSYEKRTVNENESRALQTLTTQTSEVPC